MFSRYGGFVMTATGIAPQDLNWHLARYKWFYYYLLL